MQDNEYLRDFWTDEDEADSREERYTREQEEEDARCDDEEYKGIFF